MRPREQEQEQEQKREQEQKQFPLSTPTIILRALSRVQLMTRAFLSLTKSIVYKEHLVRYRHARSTGKPYRSKIGSVMESPINSFKKRYSAADKTTHRIGIVANYIGFSKQNTNCRAKLFNSF